MEFKIIQQTPLYRALSDLGKRIFLPDGIFYWSGRAKKEAELIGTIGSAFGFEKDFIEGGSDEWLPCYLKDVKDYSNLSVKSIVPYASIGGLATIRETWKQWILKKSGYEAQEKTEKLKELMSDPIVTQGITNGIFMTCAFLLNPGESIISPNKRWGNYDNIINKFLGANIHSFEFFKDGKMNVEGLKTAILEVSEKQDKIVIILNFPNNPTGYVPTKKEAESIVTQLKEAQQEINKPIVVLVDDAYEPYVYGDNVLDRSIFYDLITLEEDVIPVKLDGISKELLAYGGRVGFATFGLKASWVKDKGELDTLKAELNNKLEGMNRSTISNANHFYQAMTQDIFTKRGMDHVITIREKVRQMLDKRCELINEELGKIESDKISVDPNSGGFFLFVNLDPSIKATDFADHLMKQYKVGVIPIAKPDIGINGIRIAYCSIDIQKIPEFIKRIKDALTDF